MSATARKTACVMVISHDVLSNMIPAFAPLAVIRFTYTRFK